MNFADSWLSHWQRLEAASGQRWPGAPPWAAGSDPSVPRAGLEDAGAAFARFAADFARIGAPLAAASDPAARAQLEQQLEALAQHLVAGAVPSWPAQPGQGAEWAVALQTWSMVLAEIARATASAFVARLRGADPPRTLRATFDAWIDCAERAFQSAAHSDAFAQAQARLLNELVRLRIRQQALLEQASRLAGLPTRREVDALHDSMQQLKAELARRPAAPAATARAPRTKRPRR